MIVYYPLRLTRERDIAAFITSITITPGTLALGVTGPKEVDEDAAAGKRNLMDAASVATSEFRTHGLTRVQRFVAVHAMYGADPQELLHGLAQMEAKLVPSVRKKKIEFDVEHLVERGVPGPRGYRGNRGGRASADGTFDIEKVDSTPHAAAFVAAIMWQEDALDENNTSTTSTASSGRRSPGNTPAKPPMNAAVWPRRRRRRSGVAGSSPRSSVLPRHARGRGRGHRPRGFRYRPRPVRPASDGGVSALADGARPAHRDDRRVVQPVDVRSPNCPDRLPGQCPGGFAPGSPTPNLNLSGDRKSRGKSAGGTAVPPLNPKGAKGAKARKVRRNAAPQEPPASTDTTHTTTEDGKK